MAGRVEGFVADGFERVADAFASNVSEHGDVGQCCVHLDGRLVADLRAGLPDDAVEVVFSATKGATAACANLLVQRGLLDLDAPVTRYWPEYGADGKEETLVRWVLSHKAGVLAPEPGLTMDDLGDWDRIVAALAEREPVWVPGSAYGYHAQTFGWLVGELVRRVDGRGLGRFFAEEVAGPAEADFWIGFPAGEEPRLAPLSALEAEPPPGFDPEQFDMSQYIGPLLMPATTLNGALPDDIVEAAADRRYRAAELGAAGGVGSARGLSRMYAWLLDEFEPGTVADILRPDTSGPDRVLSTDAMPVEQRFGRGFMVPSPEDSPTGSATFGHEGAGGTTAFADPEHRVAFAYATTRIMLGAPGGDPRAEALIGAVYDTLR
ncbi:serine hydrolase domain-containing protein [Phytomonospora sp. NPDC050363]|uniref:serine hydrolase domain-containing protein n=1 Tax=Phytomonospora sp. NPDC050363 TaxID=3155642 RepID=UPI0033E54B1F